MTTNPRPSVSDGKLQLGAGHVSYELLTMYLLLQRRPELQNLEEVFQNCFVESFLVHFRNLRDFLYPRSSILYPDPKNVSLRTTALDTVVAYDFEVTWLYEFKDWQPIAVDEADVINKSLHHISYSRTCPSPEWPFDRMYEAVKTAFGDFLTCLPVDRRNWFAQENNISPLYPDVY